MQSKALALTVVAGAFLLGSAAIVQARGRQPDNSQTTSGTTTDDTRYGTTTSTTTVPNDTDSGLYRGNPGPSGAGTTQTSNGGAY